MAPLQVLIGVGDSSIACAAMFSQMGPRYRKLRRPLRLFVAARRFHGQESSNVGKAEIGWDCRRRFMIDRRCPHLSRTFNVESQTEGLRESSKWKDWMTM